MRKSTTSKTDIILNVYDLNEANENLYYLGLGLYHSGVVIDNREYTFASESGIFSHTPRQVPGNAKFRESIKLGEFSGTQRQIEDAIAELKQDFKGQE